MIDDPIRGRVVYLGGNFSGVNGQAVRGVLRYWPQSDAWEPADLGLSSDGPTTFNDFAVREGEEGPVLYAATSAGVLKLGTSGWSRVGSNAYPTPKTLAWFPTSTGPQLIAGIDGMILALRGDRWGVLDDSIDAQYGYASDLVVMDAPSLSPPRLVALGSFNPGGASIVWNGTNWSQLVTQVSWPNLGIRSGIMHDDQSGRGRELYMGGPQGSTSGGVWRLREGVWEHVHGPAGGIAAPGYTYAFASFDDGSGRGRQLFAGGTFQGMLAAWNGHDWAARTPPTGAREFVTIIDLTEFQATAQSQPMLLVAAQVTPNPGSRFLRFMKLVSCARCAADFDHSGQVGIEDIFAFLNSWFGGLREADFDEHDGVNGQDIFAFLAAWIAGCS